MTAIVAASIIASSEEKWMMMEYSRSIPYTGFTFFSFAKRRGVLLNVRSFVVNSGVYRMIVFL
jgi:hypothetical protein